MTDTPQTPPPSDLDARRVAAAAEDLRAASRAESTTAVYERARRHYETWCEQTGRTAYPATEQTLVEYVAAMHLEDAPPSVSTVRVRLAAVRRRHVEDGHPAPKGPALDEAVQGYIRTHRVAASRQARPLHATDLPRILDRIDLTTPAGLRDRAILLLGFAGGFRRGELAAVEVAHIGWHDRGVRILIPRSKTDQEGRGYWKTIPFGDRADTCPVTALRAWLDRAEIRTGRVFRAVRKNGAVWGDGMQPAVIAGVVAKRARAAGLVVDPDARQTWSGHSLRRGFATDAVEAGVPAAKIREQGGWRGPVPVQYFDAGEAWDDPAAGRLGL